MKLLSILLGIALASAESSVVLESVEGLPGSTQIAGFDGTGNLYVLTYARNETSDDGAYHVSKLSPTREFIWSVELPQFSDMIFEMLVTSYGDLYLVLGLSKPNLLILKSGSVTAISEMEVFPKDYLYLTPNDHLIYARKNGLNIIKPNSTTPIPIKNLEIYEASPWPASGYGITDPFGNVHFVVYGRLEYWIATLSAESLQLDVPEAKLLLAQDLGLYQVPFNLVMDKNDNFWLQLTDDSLKTYVRKLVGDEFQTIITNQNLPDVTLTVANDRIYVVEGYIDEDSSAKISYISLDGQVVEILSLSDLTQQRRFHIDAVADNDGNIYFKTYEYFTPSLGNLILIRGNESEPIPINIPLEGFDYLYNMFIDGNGVVWFITFDDNLYFIEKGEAVANLVGDRNPDDTYCFRILTNPITKDVYVECTKLYLVVKNT